MVWASAKLGGRTCLALSPRTQRIGPGQGSVISRKYERACHLPSVTDLSLPVQSHKGRKGVGVRKQETLELPKGENNRPNSQRNERASIKTSAHSSNIERERERSNAQLFFSFLFFPLRNERNEGNVCF